jgi:hypothetical protein
MYTKRNGIYNEYMEASERAYERCDHLHSSGSIRGSMFCRLRLEFGTNGR